MKEKTKPQYSIFQNLSYSARQVWQLDRFLYALTVSDILLGLLLNLIQLYIAPVILQKVEQSVPLAELLLTISVFTLALLLCSSAKQYLVHLEFISDSRLTSGMVLTEMRKACTTSFPNLLDKKFQEKHIAAIRAVYQDNTGAVGKLLTGALNLVTALIGFCLYLLVLNGLHPVMLVLIIATTVISYAVGKRSNQWEYDHREEASEINLRKSYIFSTAMANEMPKDIRIFGMREWLGDVYNSALDLWKGFVSRREKHLMTAKAVDVLLSFLRNGIAYVYLIRLTLEGGLSASDFLLYFSAVTGFTEWVTRILNHVSDIHKTSLKVCELREYLDWPEPFKFEEGKPVSKEDFDRYELRLENVSFRYPESEKDTISQMNLTIHPGEKLAIVGLNGAGKTTLIKLMCGFLDPTEGRVLLNGQDIREFNRKDYYTLFTAVFQSYSRLHATIAQNVAQRISGIDQERLADCVEKAGLTQTLADLPKGLDTMWSKLLGDDGIDLSGGQIQRIMLARALYKDAPILLLDEPTAALDPIAENDMYQKYNEMTHGRTSVYISHRLASTRFCDRIIFLENGTIAEEGTHDQLMALNGGYCNLFNVQSKYYREGGNEHETA